MNDLDEEFQGCFCCRLTPPSNTLYRKLLESVYGKKVKDVRREICRRIHTIYLAIKSKMEEVGMHTCTVLHHLEQTSGDDCVWIGYLTDPADLILQDGSFDFDLHEEFPNGQTLLHYISFHDDINCLVTYFLISQGLDINEEDKFGRTPLYYLLASFNGNLTPRRLQIYLWATAELKLPREDPYFFYFRDDLSYEFNPIAIYIHVLERCLVFDYCDNNITSDIKVFVKDILQNSDSGFKWSFIITALVDALLAIAKYSSEIDVFSHFYCLVQDVCSDLDIKFQLFCYLKPDDYFLRGVFSQVEVLKFLISKGVDLNKIYFNESDNFLDLCIGCRVSESVKFLLSVGVRPKGTLNLLNDENSTINPEIKELVLSSLKPTLKNMCRLKIHKSLNIDATVKIVPRSLGEFIRFERLS